MRFVINELVVFNRFDLYPTFDPTLKSTIKINSVKTYGFICRLAFSGSFLHFHTCTAEVQVHQPTAEVNWERLYRGFLIVSTNG